MPLPELNENGILPPGLHAAPLTKIEARFGSGSEVRIRQIGLLRAVVEAARSYETIKRVLLWGSFVTAKPEPDDLDYSVIAAVMHRPETVQEEHRGFLSPAEARMFYGTDKTYLLIPDYPLAQFADKIDFIGHNRNKSACGIVEINLWGEFSRG